MAERTANTRVKEPVPAPFSAGQVIRMPPPPNTGAAGAASRTIWVSKAFMGRTILPQPETWQALGQALGKDVEHTGKIGI